MIQNSILKQNNLKKILVIKYLLTLANYLKKWKIKIKPIYTPPCFQNQFIMQKFLNSNSNINNFIMDTKSSYRVVENSDNFNGILKSTVFENKEKMFNRVFSSKLIEIYSTFFTKFKIAYLKKKVQKAYISLFISVSNAKMKSKRIQNEVI